MEIKAISYTLLLLSIALTATAQPINWDSVRADYAQKYQPQQQPAWLFPLIFEEGSGARDTAYIGYDKVAEQGGDTVFAERIIAVDTTKFNVSVCFGWYGCSGLCDSTVKVWVSKLENSSVCGDAVFEFSFINGTLPLTVYWDKAAFHSDSLPFADQSPAPRAEGLLLMSGVAEPEPHDDFGCGSFGDNPVLLTDTVTASNGAMAPCVRSDSIVFTELQNLSLEIRGWSGRWVGIKEKDKQSPKVQFSPNPFKDQTVLTISHYVAGEEKYKLRIYNRLGQVITRRTIKKSATIIQRNNMTRGLYFYSISKNQQIITTGKLLIH